MRWRWPKAMTPLLVCSVGPYAIRGRPLAIGIPLDHVAAVRPLERLMPLPGQDSGLLGFALHDGQIISVLSPTHLLGLPEADEDAEPGERSAARHLVVL